MLVALFNGSYFKGPYEESVLLNKIISRNDFELQFQATVRRLKYAGL